MMTSAAARMRLYRRREAAGRMVLRHIEIDVCPVVEMLVANGLLDPLQADDRHEIEHAIEKLLEALVTIDGNDRRYT